MNTLEKYFQTSTSSSEYVRNYLSYLSELVLKLNRDEIVKLINLLLDARQSGNTIFFIENGGSAATASNFAAMAGSRASEAVMMAVSRAWSHPAGHASGRLLKEGVTAFTNDRA